MDARAVSDARRVVDAAEVQAQPTVRPQPAARPPAAARPRVAQLRLAQQGETARRAAQPWLAQRWDFRRRATGGTAARSGVLLTARGSVGGLFIACFLTLLIADWTGWYALADLAFVAGGTAAAWYTKPGALLALAVSPPLIFFGACVCAELLTASGMFATATGIFVTLGDAAPWLFIGTALTLGVALSRGLSGEIAGLIADLRGVIRR